MTFMSAAASCGSLMSIAATSTPLSSPNRLCSCISLAETALTCMQASPLLRAGNNDICKHVVCIVSRMAFPGWKAWLYMAEGAYLGCDIGRVQEPCCTGPWQVSLWSLIRAELLLRFCRQIKDAQALPTAFRQIKASRQTASLS